MPSVRAPSQDVPATVLVVDDDDFNRVLLEALLEDQGYRIVQAEDGQQALDHVAKELPDAILLDVMMPGLDGFEVCRRLKASRRTFFIPVIMLTALADRQSRIRGLDAGADEFLHKPIDRLEVLTRLRAMLRVRALRDELDSADAVIVSLVKAQESKQNNRRPGHAKRVAHLASGAADLLQLPEDIRETIVWGSLLHDIGKVALPDAVFEGDGQRSSQTQDDYPTHAVIGDQLLQPLTSLDKVRPFVRHHHERLDGSGYPDGLSGDAFPVSLEVVAVANALDGFRHTSSRAMAPELLQVTAHRGAFRSSTVEAVLQVAEGLPDELPSPLELLPPPRSSPHGTILIADDTAAHREICQEHLSNAGYDVTAFTNGFELVDAIDAYDPDLLLVDVNMPEMDGEAVCRRLRDLPRYAHLPIILVTAERGPAGKENALACGADDFLLMPVDPQELLARTRALLRLRTYRQDLEAREAIVISFSQVLEAKDPYTRGHSQRVGDLARGLARRLAWNRHDAENLYVAGLLHDIGKVAVPDRILHKPGRLDADELEILRSHPRRGWDMCRHLSSVAHALPAILYHHERLDGSGYPEGLAGDAIPIQARIMGVADAFDALTSDRPYRARLAMGRAFAILRQETEAGMWDPEVLQALEGLAEDGTLGQLHPAFL